MNNVPSLSPSRVGPDLGQAGLSKLRPYAALAFAFGLTSALAGAADWPMWGGSPSRNMVSTSKGLPAPEAISAGKFLPKTETIDPKSTKHVRWVAKLGSQAYGTPVVAGGRVYVGTNNESPRDPKQHGDRGVLMCFDEKTGEFLWQLVVPKLGSGKVSDWEYVGICSSPTIEGDRGYVVTNRGEVVCFDVKGMADGNQGFADEAKFGATEGKPIDVTAQTADILWVSDVRTELGIFPHNISSCSPLIVGDRLYIATSNGVDWSHLNIPAPFAPALAVLDKRDGKIVGEEVSGVSKRVLHCSWSSPSFTTVNGKGVIVWGGGDGWCYAYDPVPVLDKDGTPVLKELLRYDANPPEYRTKEGQPLKYATFNGPSELICTVVAQDGRAYMSIGQDPEHGDGIGMFSCIDLTGRGDITGKPIWTNKSIGRTICTPSIADGLIYIAEYNGNIHCLDAATGKTQWMHPTNSRIWSSTLVADGKVYCGTEDGELVVLAAGREKKLLGKVEFYSPIYSSPVIANDTLFVATITHVFAIAK
ncbi:MAG: PQQ-binding-like beta-propeller repeat protein [Opitutaceae bacterium]|nr:PQQ-binding-like beta-propeller repeat protein [Opitutaceae bacterium]